MSAGLIKDAVSVVVGAYNAAPWIGETLESVLDQTHPILELLVVDDGSTDDTPSIVRGYGDRVKFIREEHRGRPHRNRGILESKGEWVAFVDADDFWHPQKIEKQLALMKERKTSWVICDIEWLDSSTGSVTPALGASLQEGDILQALFLGNFIAASTTLVSRSVLEDVGYFDETEAVAPAEDWDLWLRIAAKYPVACVREKLVRLRLHPDSFLASTPLARRVQSLENVVSRAVARNPVRLAGLREIALFRVYYAAGVHLFRQQRLVEARSFFQRALRQKPANLESAAYVVLTFLGVRISKLVLRVKRALTGGR